MKFELDSFFRSPPQSPHSIHFRMDGNCTRHIFLGLVSILKYGVYTRYSRGGVINFDYIPESELFTLRRYFNSLGIELFWKWTDSLDNISDPNNLSDYKMSIKVKNRNLQLHFGYLERPRVIYRNVNVVYN